MTYAQKYYKKNRERLLEYAEAYRLDNRRKINKQKKQYYSRPEIKLRQQRYYKKYYLKNKEKYRKD